MEILVLLKLGKEDSTDMLHASCESTMVPQWFTSLSAESDLNSHCRRRTYFFLNQKIKYVKRCDTFRVHIESKCFEQNSIRYNFYALETTWSAAKIENNLTKLFVSNTL